MFYTPSVVAQAHIRLIWDALVLKCGLSRGAADERVAIVDPAAGSGAYPLALAREMGARGFSRAGLGQRMLLYETSRAAATLAEARLAAAGVEHARVEVADALTQQPLLEAPVVVCLGNPPYGRYSTQVAGRERARDLVQAGAGLHAKNLYNTHVYFWHWALHLACEARSGSGVASFLTPSAYLTGPGYGGLRDAMRRAFDWLWILDLGGDARGARPTPNVFDEVRTPVAIGLGVRVGAGAQHRLATVHYATLRGTRAEKLAQLASVNGLADLDWRPAEDASTAFVPRSRSRYWAWPALTDVFPWQASGCQVKRTWPIAPEPEVLVTRWRALLAHEPAVRETWFAATRDRTPRSRVKGLDGEELEPLDTLDQAAAYQEPVPYAYRAFDRQWLLADPRVVDFLRPSLWRSLGPRQVFLTSLLTHALGQGPAVIATRLMPDLDHFRGSFGGRAVMPLWLDPAGTRPNVAERWLGLMPPQDVLAYVYGVLANPSYVEGFMDELRLGCARVPFAADACLRQEVVRLGQRLLEVQTFSSTPIGSARCLRATEGPLPERFTYEPGLARLRVGAVEIEAVQPAVWAYSVSGLRVLPSWLGYRLRHKKGRSSSPLDAIRPAWWSAEFTAELLRVIWTLEATLAEQPAMDRVLRDVLRATPMSLTAAQ